MYPPVCMHEAQDVGNLVDPDKPFPPPNQIIRSGQFRQFGGNGWQEDWQLPPVGYGGYSQPWQTRDLREGTGGSGYRQHWHPPALPHG